jgi:HAUS augmin-like complex subunit 3
MSGHRLAALLEELGYGSRLDPDGLDWPFQYEDTRPLMEWICSNVSAANVLTQQEVSLYNELVQEQKVATFHFNSSVLPALHEVLVVFEKL